MTAGRRRGRGQGRALAAALLAVVAPAGCAGAPWFLGEPFDQRQVVPTTSRVETVADHRRKLAEARRRSEKVLEVAELLALEARGALGDQESARLAQLLKERARDWIALRRPIPLALDLRHLVALEPGRERALSAALRNAERAAGDAWLALGDNARAEEEYRRAERLGAAGMLFRLRAAWGASPADSERPVLERALADLPERALPPFAAAYLDSGGTQPPLLRRAYASARVYGPPALTRRLEALPGAPGFEPPTTPRDEGDDDRERAPAASGGAVKLVAPASPSPPPPAGEPARAVAPGAPPMPRPPVEPPPGPHPAEEDRLYGGATLSRTLLPRARAFPDLAAPGTRSRAWAELLLAEDPTSPDSLEFAAQVDARAGRLDGAARKLVDLVFYSLDCSTGYSRAARLWDSVGQGRRACLAWERAAQFGAADDDHWCDLLTCLQANPGAGDASQLPAHLTQRCSPPPPSPPSPSSPESPRTLDLARPAN